MDIREENPDLSQSIKEIRRQLEGTKVVIKILHERKQNKIKIYLCSW